MISILMLHRFHDKWPAGKYFVGGAALLADNDIVSTIVGQHLERLYGAALTAIKGADSLPRLAALCSCSLLCLHNNPPVFYVSGQQAWPPVTSNNLLHIKCADRC